MKALIPSLGLIAAAQVPLIHALFAQVSTAEAGGVAGGAAAGLTTGIGSVAAILWLLKKHSDDMREKTAAFVKERQDDRAENVRREEAKDRLFAATITAMTDKFEGALSHFREDNQRIVDRQFTSAREIVEALMHVSDSLQVLSQRVTSLEGGHGEESKGDTPSLPPHNPPPRPGRRG